MGVVRRGVKYWDFERGLVIPSFSLVGLVGFLCLVGFCRTGVADQFGEFFKSLFANQFFSLINPGWGAGNFFGGALVVVGVFALGGTFDIVKIVRILTEKLFLINTVAAIVLAVKNGALFSKSNGQALDPGV